MVSSSRNTFTSSIQSMSNANSISFAIIEFTLKDASIRNLRARPALSIMLLRVHQLCTASFQTSQWCSLNTNGFEYVRAFIYGWSGVCGSRCLTWTWFLASIGRTDSAISAHDVAARLCAGPNFAGDSCIGVMVNFLYIVIHDMRFTRRYSSDWFGSCNTGITNPPWCKRFKWTNAQIDTAQRASSCTHCDMRNSRSNDRFSFEHWL